VTSTGLTGAIGPRVRREAPGQAGLRPKDAARTTRVDRCARSEEDARDAGRNGARHAGRPRGPAPAAFPDVPAATDPASRMSRSKRGARESFSTGRGPVAAARSGVCVHPAAPLQGRGATVGPRQNSVRDDRRASDLRAECVPSDPFAPAAAGYEASSVRVDHGQMYPAPPGALKQPIDSGSRCLGSHRMTFGQKIVNAIVPKKMT